MSFLAPVLILALALAGAGRHPASASRTHVVVEGSRAELVVECQSLSLIEALPGLDGNRDQFLDVADLEARRGEIEAYFLRTVGLLVPDGAGERELSATFAGLELLPEPVSGPFGLQWLRVRLSYEVDWDLESFVVVTAAFHERNPWHEDRVFVDWNGEQIERHVPEGDRRTLIEPAHVRRPRVFGEGLLQGLRAPLRLLSPACFVLALALASMRLRGFLLVSLGFLAAAALAFHLGAREAIEVPSRFVVLAGTLSTAYVSADLLVRGTRRELWVEALGFGLIFGLLWADDHAGFGVDPPVFTASLLGYQLGASLISVLLGTLFLSLGVQRFASAVEGAGPRRLTRTGRVLAGLLSLVGLALFVRSAGWF